LYSFQQFTQTSIFILINPFNNFQDCKLMIHVSQVQQMSLMRITKLLMRLQRRIMRQRRKKKRTTVPTRQRKSQPLRLNQRMTTTQITISPEGKTAQLLKVFLSHVYLQCNYFNLSTHHEFQRVVVILGLTSVWIWIQMTTHLSWFSLCLNCLVLSNL